MTLTLTDLLTTFGPTDALAATLGRAERYAQDQQHRALTLEHLLLALSEDPDAAIVLSGCHVDLMRLKMDVSGYLGQLEDRVPQSDGGTSAPALTEDLVRIFKVAHAAAGQKQRAPSGGLVLAAIVGDGRSPAANMLRVQGLTFDAAIQALQSANAQLRAEHTAPPTPGAQAEHP
ncbi:MAG: Clp protease N-terminal domain-containing protein, partial [Pseudomonadota bacterium]